ncbi:MAG: substrate-binding domain-containing protein [Gemmatimonadota bacterium]|nr:substrate-binding domain-containing protein [Gemmatimonadota bacterium]
MTRSINWRAAACAMGMALVACGGSADKTATDTTAKAGGAASTASGSNKIVIAMIAKSSTNAVFLAARTGAEAAAKELSQKSGVPVEVMWLTPPQEDGEVQAQRIRQAVNDGASAVLLSASDAGKVTGAINDAVDRGVPVMMFDSDAPKSKRFAFYGVDDHKTGVTTMSELAKQLGGKGKVAILAGNQNAPNLQMRVQGVKDEAKKYPGITIVGTFNHIETAQDAAAEVIRANNAYPEITGWAMIGGWPLFTQTLLTDLDPKKQKVVAVDALPDELAYVEKGIAPVLLAQPVYLWGDVGVRTLFAKVHDKKDPPSAIMPMELVRVSKDNLGTWARQLKDWGFTNINPVYLALKQ